MSTLLAIKVILGRGNFVFHYDNLEFSAATLKDVSVFTSVTGVAIL